MNPPAGQTEFVPIRPNPYIVGNPVRDRSLFFGREAEFELVRNRFQHSERGGILVFCGERRSGKTSILFQIQDGRLGPDFIPVLIDMQSMSVDNEIDFLGKIATEIARSLGSDRDPVLDFAPPKRPSAVFLEFVERMLLVNPAKKPILMFDEYELIESKIDSGVLTTDILSILANLLETHPFFLIFTGSQPIQQRRREYWQILGKSIYRRISYLQEADAVRLITEPVRGRVHHSTETIASIYRLTAGQAFYTQAICQNLVDDLNDHQTGTVTAEAVERVTDDLVDNPLPQMIFLWDGFEREEKLVLALLAQSLSDGRGFAQADDLLRALKSGGYPLDLARPAIATALEKLFEKEFLLKDTAENPGYAFRMDLWRWWVYRMHSVWQVMREEGLDIRRPKRARTWWLRAASLAGLGLALVALVLLGVKWLGSRKGTQPTVPATAASHAGFLSVVTFPSDAGIYVDEELTGTGLVRRNIGAGEEHRLRVAAPGYADSTLRISLASGEEAEHQIRLRPLRGAVRIETVPAGGEIAIDGIAEGTSPLVVSNLAVPEPHAVSARMPGYHPVERQIRVLADSVLGLPAIELTPITVSVWVSSNPTGATVAVDGTPIGRSPLSVPDLRPGSHTFRLTDPGYVAVDTLIAVTERMDPVNVVLDPAPPGVLVVLGDRPATIFVDGRLISPPVQYSGPIELNAGWHSIEARPVSGETVVDSVQIASGVKVTFDFSQKRVVGQEPIGD